MIKKIENYEVDGKLFNTKKEAESYIDCRKRLVISSGADVSHEINKFNNQDVFLIIEDSKDAVGRIEPKTLMQIIDLILGENIGRYSGMCSYLPLIPNYKIEIRDFNDTEELMKDKNNTNIDLIIHNREINLSNVPLTTHQAIKYVTTLLKDTLALSLTNQTNLK